jgi:hypothetical protein
MGNDFMLDAPSGGLPRADRWKGKHGAVSSTQGLLVCAEPLVNRGYARAIGNVCPAAYRPARPPPTSQGSGAAGGGPLTKPSGASVIGRFALGSRAV